jgi:acetyl-coA carboxylase, biotin carboxyl carrier protein
MDAQKRLHEIITQFSEHSLTELEFEIPDFKLRLSKVEAKSEQRVYIEREGIPVSTGDKADKTEKNGEEIRAILVGTVYLAPAPDAEDFAVIGKRVAKGDTMCIIEAMKIMNELCAPYDLIVKNVCCKNGKMVQFDEVLFEVERC